MTATRGLSFSAIAWADIGSAVGSTGKWLISSNSPSPAATMDGNGATDKATTPTTEVNRPLTVSSVANNDVQSCRVRGGKVRIATRITIATRHRRGKTSTRGDKVHFAQRGTAGSSVGCIRAGTSGETSVRAISAGLIIILSMQELPKERKAGGEYNIFEHLSRNF